MARVRASKASNSVYDVKFDPPLSDEKPPPIFGAKYNFHLEGIFLDFFFQGIKVHNDESTGTDSQLVVF